MPVFERVAFAKSGPASDARGVGQRANALMATNPAELPASLFPSFAFARLVGVGHKPQSISAMGRIDGTSWEYGSPDGVTRAVQVNAHSVEPMLSNRVLNLLSHDCCRADGINKAEPYGPEIALVLFSKPFACEAVGLTWARTCPKGTLVRPSSKSSCIGPPADACEEMALGVAFKVARLDIRNAPVINIAGRNQASGNEVAQPLGGVGIEFVVIGGHHSAALALAMPSEGQTIGSLRMP